MTLGEIRSKLRYKQSVINELEKSSNPLAKLLERDFRLAKKFWGISGVSFCGWCDISHKEFKDFEDFIPKVSASKNPLKFMTDDFDEFKDFWREEINRLNNPKLIREEKKLKNRLEEIELEFKR